MGTDLMLGVGGVHGVAPPAQGVQAGGDSLYPVGGVGLRYALASRSVSWTNRFTFLASPSPDRISGAVNQRLSLGLGSTLAPVRQLAFDVNAAASRSLGVIQRDIRIEGRATYLLGPALGISLGGRVAWLEGSTLLGPQGFGWLALLSVGTSVGTTTTLFGESR